MESPSGLGVNSFEVDTDLRRCMDATPRSSVVKEGKVVVLALCPRVYWEKQLNYAIKFLIRSSRDKVIMLHFTGPKDVADAMSEVMDKARAILLKRTRLSDAMIETVVRPLGKHSVHSCIATFCKEVNASILVLGSRKRDPHHGFFSFHKHEKVESHCRQALVATRVVHVAPPAGVAEA
ncbi:hypothetical protein ACKKBG_A20770 [Auxenochlorella protothecoides x Auxenochlorella symbiontica]|uniref:UspA domain-containing protein n=1 Tax=Auxenochlorella protothecoides TaxID=3075 RepID=A0A1D2AHC9_AUXPR